MYEIFLKLLDEKGVTAYKVGKATGIAGSTFTDWKTGRSVPKQEKLQKIADYFGVTVEYLMTGKEPELDYLYSDENTDFMIEFTNKARNDKEFLERMKRYMELLEHGNTAVNEMIDFQYDKQQKEEG